MKSLGPLGPEVNIQVEQTVTFTPASANFYNQCVEWAQKLNVSTVGGVSVKFFGQLQASLAVIWWNGQGVMRLVRYGDSIRKLVDGRFPDKNPVVNDRNIATVMREGLCQIISQKEAKSASLRAKFNAAKWETIPTSY